LPRTSLRSQTCQRILACPDSRVESPFEARERPGVAAWGMRGFPQSLRKSLRQSLRKSLRRSLRQRPHAVRRQPQDPTLSRESLCEASRTACARFRSMPTVSTRRLRSVGRAPGARSTPQESHGRTLSWIRQARPIPACSRAAADPGVRPGCGSRESGRGCSPQPSRWVRVADAAPPVKGTFRIPSDPHHNCDRHPGSSQP